MNISCSPIAHVVRTIWNLMVCSERECKSCVIYMSWCEGLAIIHEGSFPSQWHAISISRIIHFLDKWSGLLMLAMQNCGPNIPSLSNWLCFSLHNHGGLNKCLYCSIECEGLLHTSAFVHLLDAANESYKLLCLLRLKLNKGRPKSVNMHIPYGSVTQRQVSLMAKPSLSQKYLTYTNCSKSWVPVSNALC